MSKQSQDALVAAVLAALDAREKRESKPAKSEKSEEMPQEITLKSVTFRAIASEDRKGNPQVTYHLVKSNGQITRHGFLLATLKGLK